MNQELSVPNHLGLILDGNRRWAKENGLPKLGGYQSGYENLKEITKHAFDRGVLYVSVYVFSAENWSRTKTEVNFLMSLLLKVLTTDLDEINKENIKIIWLGDSQKLSKKIIKAIDNAETATKNNTGGTLCLCFNYGGVQEIVQSVKNIVEQKIPVNKIDENTIANNLYAPKIPSLDLIVRTSGEHRLSGFMLFRSAYSEFYFTDKQWPSFSKSDLDLAFTDFSNRNRRFGK